MELESENGTSDTGNHNHNAEASQTDGFTQLSEQVEEDTVATEENMMGVHSLLVANKRVKLGALVLDRHSFSQTAANMLALSFLLKDGRAEVEVADGQNLFVAPKCSPDERELPDEVKRCIFGFTYNDWELMRQQVQPGEELILNTESISAKPSTILKGIRSKVRKRKAYSQTTSDAFRMPTATEAAIKLSDPILDDGGSLGWDTMEIKPRKALLTYSRRRKQQNMSNQLEEVKPKPTETYNLVKRYSRRGEALTKNKPLEEPKKNTEGKIILDKLATVPKRKRTAYGTAFDGHLGVFDASSRRYCKTAGSSPDCALKESGGSGDEEEKKPLIIAPKRFKKSALRPRQALRAQVKARLKAVFKTKNESV